MKLKRSLCAFLAFIFLLLQVPFGSFAETDDTFSEIETSTLFLEESAPSETGYVHYQYVDEEGNPVNMGNRFDLMSEKDSVVGDPELPSSYDSRD